MIQQMVQVIEVTPIVISWLYRIYLGVGAVFPTGSKDDAIDVSFDTLKAICSAVSIPVVAIGGITLRNTPELAGSGICGIAVISAIYGQADIKEAASSLKKVTEETVNA